MKDFSAFNSRVGAADGLRSECKDCAAIATAAYRATHKTQIAVGQRRYREQNSQVVAAKDREKHLKTKYGLTGEDYEVLRSKQQFSCALCKRTEEEVGRLHVDHDHGTGRVRGLLCGSCNRGLGCFLEEVTILFRAIRYLGEFHD